VSLLAGCAAGQSSHAPVRARLESAREAAVFAAKIANEECARRLDARPFKPEHWPAVQRDGRWHWGQLELGGPGGYSAEVSFDVDGGNVDVQIYWTVDGEDR
jgi:hypothetical protein